MQRPSPQKRLFARLIILAVLLTAAWFVWHRQQQTTQIGHHTEQRQTEQGNTKSTSTVPAYVLEVLDFIRQNGYAPDGYVGGREFQNKEKRLPAKDSGNQRIRYSE